MHFLEWFTLDNRDCVCDNIHKKNMHVRMIMTVMMMMNEVETNTTVCACVCVVAVNAFSFQFFCVVFCLSHEII